jgi:hypothetical protein
MNQLEIQEAARRQPFRPFRLVLTNGEAFDVHHPELIMIGRRSAVIGIPKSQKQTYYERTTIVDLLHVVRIENLPPSGTTKNGQAK